MFGEKLHDGMRIIIKPVEGMFGVVIRYMGDWTWQKFRTKSGAEVEAASLRQQWGCS